MAKLANGIDLIRIEVKSSRNLTRSEMCNVYLSDPIQYNL